MARLSGTKTAFTPRLDERMIAEFHAHSLALLPFPLRHDAATLDASALRLSRPEPPRDPDLPLLPPKKYPRYTSDMVEAAVRALQPPPPVDDFVGRRAELDRAVMALLADRPVVLCGESGTGKTALLRQIAHDSRVRAQFRRIWWLDDLYEAGMLLGLALEAPAVLMAEHEAQPGRLREFLTDARVLLLVDSTAGTYTLDGMDWALGCTSNIVIASRDMRQDGLALGPLPTDTAVEWLARRAPKAAEDARALAGLVDHRPGPLGLIAALVIEDDASADLITEALQNVPTHRMQGALYVASMAAMPSEYLALCRVFALTGRRWIAPETAQAHFENGMAGRRALAFLERRGFLERREDVAGMGRAGVRVMGDWAMTLPDEGDQDEGFDPIPRVTEGFNIDAYDERIAGAEALYERSVTMIDECRDEEAAAALGEVYALFEAHGMRYHIARTLMAQARLAHLQGDDPIRLLEKAAEHLHDLREEESLEIVRVALSRAYRRAGRLDAALSVLDDDSSPEDLAAIYQAREAWAEAIAVYERWVKADGGEAARHGLAEAYLLAGRYADALATVADDDTFGGQYVRALVYHLQGDVKKALSAYTMLQPDTPGEYRAVVARAAARALAESGDVRAAAMLVGAEGVWYESKLPRPAFARQRLSQALYAHFLYMVGSVGEAEAAARAVHALTRERPDPEAEAIACRVLGRIAWQTGQISGAIHAFETEISARGAMSHRDDHEIGISLHNLADVQREAKGLDRAIANYRRALTDKLTNKTRDRSSAALTCLALIETLVEAGRVPEALEAGTSLLELFNRGSDLRLYGYGLSYLAKLQFEAGRAPRGAALLDDWLNALTERHAEALDHPYWGVQALAIALYLRSLPPLDSQLEGETGGDPLPLIDLAERAMVLAAREAPGTAAAYAARRDLGALYLRMERWNDARDVLDPLLADQSVPTVAPFVALAAHLGTARASARLGQLEDALTHYDSALVYEPEPLARGVLLREAAEMCRETGDDAHAADYYAKALPLLEPDLATYVDVLVALAYTRLRLRRFGEAIDTFGEALDIAEKSARTDSALMASVLFDMAAAHDSLGQYRAAAETYRRSLAFQDRNRAERYRETLVALARSEANAESYQPAVEAYYDALQSDLLTDAQRRTLLIEQGATFAKLDQAQAAINAYDAALGIEGASSVEKAAIHRGLGTVYARLDSHDEARDHFQAALDAVQDDLAGVTLGALADSYRAQGMHKEAIDTYNRALAFLDRKANVLESAAAERALGEIYLERRQLSNAIVHLEAALDLERGLPQQRGGQIVSLLQSLANAQEMRGELDKAAVRHHEALVYQDVRHAPTEYVHTLRTLGRLYVDMARYGEASKAYEEALRVEARQPRPDPATLDAIHVGLGGVRQDQGALEAAAELYRRVTVSPTDSPARRQASEALKIVSTEIARHMNTLDVADQSLTLLSKTPRPDLKGLVFVRALQAQTSAALGRKEDTEGYLIEMFKLLMARRTETGGAEPVMHVLALLIEGWDHESAGETEAAREAYRAALEAARRDAKSNSSLVWAIQYKVDTLK